MTAGCGAGTAPDLRIVVVDDHPLVRRGIVLVLRTEPGLTVVGETGDGPSAVELVEHLVPDVVLMDVRMPGGDGVEATRRIVEGPAGGTRVLMLTTYHADEEVHAALVAGASGYILKDAEPDELVLAIQAVAAGDGWLHPTVAGQVVAGIAGPAADRDPAAAHLRRAGLTPREVEVLGLVAHGLTNRQIMAHLVVSEATVKTHVNRLLLKLACETRAQLVAAAFHAAVVTPGSAPPAAVAGNGRAG